MSFESFVIDAGHGGYDSGIKGANFSEKEITMSLAKDFANALAGKGKKVLLTRKSDYAISIKERVRIANQGAPDIFISMHISSENTFVIYSLFSDMKNSQSGVTNAKFIKNTAVVKGIAQAINREFKMSVRHEELPIPLIVQIESPALLIEMPRPDKFNYDRKMRERIINAILKGLDV
ncbi:MAG: N-acetylmuramoyl-L-alanine amidase [Thermodesulfovibrionales bacterium]|nr:N-acetylmuramoyl-L-alanine amidase [Thermodesulfovibrionales bacterium]